MSDHRFAGMRRDDDLGWYGTCTCGHAELPCQGKDIAWEEIGFHIVARNPELRALQEEAALRRLFGRLE